MSNIAHLFIPIAESGFNTNSLSTIFTIFASIIHLETVNSNEKTDKRNGKYSEKQNKRICNSL